MLFLRDIQCIQVWAFYAYFFGELRQFWVIQQLDSWLRTVFRGSFLVFIIFLVIFPRHDFGIRVRVFFLYIVRSPHYEGPSFAFRFLHIANFELIVRALVTEIFSALINTDTAVPSHRFLCNFVNFIALMLCSPSLLLHS